MATVGNIVEGTINANYKVIIEVLMEVYFKVIARKNAIFILLYIFNSPKVIAVAAST